MSALLLLLVPGCRSGGTPQPGRDTTEVRVTRPPISEVLKKHGPELMAIAGVVGTGEGEQGGAPCILVLVKRKTPEIERAIPSSLEGYPVRIEEVGEVRPIGRGK